MRSMLEEINPMTNPSPSVVTRWEAEELLNLAKAAQKEVETLLGGSLDLEKLREMPKTDQLLETMEAFLKAHPVTAVPLKIVSD